MAELDDILAEYRYAETVTRMVWDGKVKVTLAEANAERNRAFARCLVKHMRQHGLDRMDEDFPEDVEIDVFCASLLKGWDLTVKGEPILPEAAAPYLKASLAGRVLFREMGAICRDSEQFELESSKKKPSSATSQKASTSATRRKSSPTKPKAAASRSRGVSKAS